jgi:hypothetical protein
MVRWAWLVAILGAGRRGGAGNPIRHAVMLTKAVLINSERQRVAGNWQAGSLTCPGSPTLWADQLAMVAVTEVPCDAVNVPKKRRP